VVGRGRNQDSYFSRLHLVGIATLFVLTLGLGLVGWAVRPASGGFSAVPDNLALYIQKAARGLEYTVTMSPMGGGGAVLTLEGVGESDAIPSVPFTPVADNLGDGRICTPSALTGDQDR
jgi:hypothetical protein